MSQFVNYKKRGLTLPPGCKDLSDVLERQGLQPLLDLSRLGSSGGSVSGRLFEIEKYVQMAFRSRALWFTLVVSPPDKRLTFHIARMRRKAVQAYVLVEKAAPREAAAGVFFARHGLQSTQLSPIMPEQQFLVRSFPMPSDRIILTKLATDLFREVYRLTDESELFYGSSNIIVVILDVGVQTNHPDINQFPGTNFTSDASFDGGPVNACDNHGTTVAGCVSAIMNNNLGTIGIVIVAKIWLRQGRVIRPGWNQLVGRTNEQVPIA